MERISSTEVRFTDEEMAALDLQDRLLNAGHSTLASVEMLESGKIPYEEAARAAIEVRLLIDPEYRRGILTDEFLAYLRDEHV